MEISFAEGRTRAKFLEMQSDTVAPYIKTLRTVLNQNNYLAPEASVNLPGDNSILELVDKLVETLDVARLRYVFLIGIGGSYLGAKAIYDALYSHRDMTTHQATRLVCIDTNNPSLLMMCQTLISTLKSPNEYFVIIASKSGATTETIANAEIVLQMLDTQWPRQATRVCVISDDGSALLQAGAKLGMHTLAVPPKVGGRYSVFSAVGLLPLRLLGVDVEALLKGAETMLESGTHLDSTINPASASALVRAYEYEAGKTIHDWFVFASELASLGGWWRQLIGESLGKNGSNGVIGITPTVSVGSNDLHSVGQLYLGGRKDKYHTFITIKNIKQNFMVPKTRVFPPLVKMINGVAVTEIMDAIVSGTKGAFSKHNVPFMSILLEAVTPYELGAFMQFAMLETIYLGRLLEVNPFDQPDVEAYKTITKEILQTKHN